MASGIGQKKKGKPIVETYRGKSATYVQAWVCKGTEFDGIVYDAKIMLDKMGEGCDIESATIVRHDNGDREHLDGTVAVQVFAYREG